MPALESLLHLLMVFIKSVSHTYNKVVTRVMFDWLKMVKFILNCTQTTRIMISWVRQLLYNWRKVTPCGFVCPNILHMLFMVVADTQHLLDIWSLTNISVVMLMHGIMIKLACEWFAIKIKMFKSSCIVWELRRANIQKCIYYFPIDCAVFHDQKWWPQIDS